MFESIQEKLGAIFRRLRGRGKITEQDLNDTLREVRLVLLEADVSLKVVKEFTEKVKEKAIGAEVWKSLTPAQQIIKFVKDQLVEIMGEKVAELELHSQVPATIMIIGLNGSGKTTTSAKLARHLKNKGHNPLLVAADIYRPAAINQLQVLGKQIEVPVFTMGDKISTVTLVKEAKNYALKNGRDILIIDTAGRQHIDEALMQELKDLQSHISPQEILLVVDAMTGQDAVKSAQTFHQEVGITGVILTKMDGDARGGAAISVKEVTGKPIKFIGVGEKIEGLEPFHPDRMAQRILGMGDVLTLIEKAEAAIDTEKIEEMQQKMLKESFTLADFMDQLQQIKRMGPLEDLLGMIPGFSHIKSMKNFSVDQKELVKIEAIIQSMTREERVNPKIFNASRKKRVATGSGVQISDVNKLLKQYEMMKKMMKQFMDMGKKTNKMPAFRMPF